MLIVVLCRCRGLIKEGGRRGGYLVELDVDEVVLPSGERGEPGMQVVRGVVDSVQQVVNGAGIGI
jgi:hypothetical protein